MSIIKRLHTPILTAAAFALVFTVPVLVDQVASKFSMSSALVNTAQAAKQETRKLPGLREKIFKNLAKVAEYASPEEGSGKEPDLKAALAELNKIEKRCDDCNQYELSQVYNYFAWISYSLEDTDGAIKYYKKVIEQSPNIPIGLELQALKYVSQLSFTIDKLDDSVNYLNRYIDLSDDVGADIYQLRASICYQKGDKACAIRDINKAISMVEGRDKIADEQWYSLQNALYLDKEDYKTSVAILEKMVRNFPKHTYWIQLSSVYGVLGRDQDQWHTMDAIYLMGGLKKPQDVVNLAYMYIGEGVPFRAAKILEKGMKDKLVERSEKHLDVLAIAWRQAKNPEKAAPVLKEIGDRFNSGEAYSKLSGVYLDMDKNQESVDAALTAIKKGNAKDEAGVYSNLGIAYMELKKFDSAINAFTKASKSKKHKQFANSWLKYAKSEKQRKEALASALNG